MLRLGACLLFFSIAVTAFADTEAARSLYLSGDHMHAIQEAEPAALKGDVEAQVIMGLVLSDGREITPDYNVAA